jgi:hypothetical protein
LSGSKKKELSLANKELELQINELEQKNIQFVERISGLEAQSRYLTDEQELIRAELHRGLGIADSVIAGECRGAKRLANVFFYQPV